MNFKCPQCGYKCNYNEIKGDADLMAVIRLQPVFGAHASLVWAYAEQFGATVHQARVKKLRLVLEEMASLFQVSGFTFRGKRYEISRDGIVQALNVVAHKSFETKLENHNYLKKVMLDIAVKENDARAKREETDLRDREDAARRQGEHLTDEQIEENKAKVQELIRSQ